MATKKSVIDHDRIIDFAQDTFLDFGASAGVIMERIIASLEGGTANIDLLSEHFQRFPLVNRLLDYRNIQPHLFLPHSSSEISRFPAVVREQLAVMNAMRGITEVVQAVSALVVRLEAAKNRVTLPEEDLSILKNNSGFCQVLIEIAQDTEAKIVSEVHAQHHMVLNRGFMSIAQRGTREQFENALDALLS